MKIVIVGQRWNPSLSGKIMGGAENIERSQVKLMSSYGHAVHFITSSDSDEVGLENTVTYRIIPSKGSAEGEALGKRYNAIRNPQIVTIVRNVEPDVVLIHDDSNPSLYNLIANELSDYPTAAIVHSCPAISGGIGIISFVESMRTLCASGGTVAAVSLFSKLDWEFQASKLAKWLSAYSVVDNTYLNDHIHCVIYDQKPVAQLDGGFGFMATRVVKAKKIYQAAKYHKEAGIPFKLCGIVTDDEEQKDYLQKILTVVKENDVLVNNPRLNVTNLFSRARFVSVLGSESFSIMAVEGNMYGAKVLIFNESPNHAAMEACTVAGSKVQSYEHIQEKDEKDIIEHLKAVKPLSFEERIQLSADTYEFFKPESSYERLFEFCDRVIKRKQNSPKEDKNTLF